MNTSCVSVPDHLSYVLGASSSDVTTVNRLQLAGVPAYLVVPHEEALVLGAINVDQISPSFRPSFVTQDWENLAPSHPMPLLYTGVPSPMVHDIVSRPPHYVSLERYFFGLDDDLAVVPIGERGIVCVASVKAAASKQRNKCSSNKCKSFLLFSLLPLIVPISCTYC